MVDHGTVEFLNRIQEENDSLRDEVLVLERANEDLKDRIETNKQYKENDKTTPVLARKRKYSKPFGELSERGKRKRKRKIESIFNEASEEIGKDVKRITVELVFDHDQVLKFCPREPENSGSLCTTLRSQTEEEERKLVQQILSIKDAYQISDKALHELHMITGQAIPPLNKLKDERGRLNSLIQISTSPEPGSDCSSRRLEDLLSYLLQQTEYRNLMEVEGDVNLLLRFACDGAKLTQKINSVRGVFKIIHPRDNLPSKAEDISMSPTDEHTLFFYVGDESRCTMKKYGQPTFNEMERLAEEGMMLLGKKVNISWLLTCDWKALALLRGINAANSKNFCVWCHCTKDQIRDFSIPSWPITRSKLDQTSAMSFKDHKGYIAEDMCSFIDYKMMPIDDLHMRMRISLKLFNQIVTWSVDQKAEGKLVTEMKRIGVAFHFWEERGDDKTNVSVKKWSQPNGDDLRTIIRDMKLINVLENKRDKHLALVSSLSVDQLKSELQNRGLSCKGKKCVLVARLQEAVGEGVQISKKSKKSRLAVSYEFEEEDYTRTSLNIDDLQALWNEFHDIIDSLRSPPGSEKYIEADVLMERCRKWAQDFRKSTFDEDVTPYIHAMVYHLPVFLKEFRYLHDIGVAQVERKKFDQRQAYFGSTSRNGGRYKEKMSLQILQRENRMLWCASEGVPRVKRPYVRRNVASEYD